MKTPPNRRSALKYLAGGSAAFVAANLNYRIQAAENLMDAPLKGKINHSVCRWCYGGIKLDDLAVAAKQMGITSIELLTPGEFATVKKYGLTCAMVMGLTGGYGIEKGWNRPENHDPLVEQYQVLIKQTAEAGLTNLICFSGNRAGLSDAEGLENCATGLKKIMALAEKHKVTLVMELLNSKVDHKDYMCDHTAWGVELCKKVGSDSLKLLYDIYHMQIMEGDVIRTIRDYHAYIAHYHTGGVPGRNEIDNSQELYYPAIMQAIVDTGYKGFVAQEFIPKREDKLASLKQGVMICDI
jgi:hydroxypyruvate isomerase